MTDNDAPCKELNEIIAFISKELWKRTNLSLIKKVQDLPPETNITGKDAIDKLCKELKRIGEEENQKYRIIYFGSEQFGIRLTPSSIYIHITTIPMNKQNYGDFWISTPNISTRSFPYPNYKAGIKWIQEYIQEAAKTNVEIQNLYDHYYLSIKNSEIIKQTIDVLCSDICKKKYRDYWISQNRLMSNILIQTTESEDEYFEILIYHNPFSENPNLLLELLNEPKEMTILQFLKCQKIDSFIQVSTTNLFGIYTDYFHGDIII